MLESARRVVIDILNKKIDAEKDDDEVTSGLASLISYAITRSSTGARRIRAAEIRRLEKLSRSKNDLLYRAARAQWFELSKMIGATSSTALMDIPQGRGTLTLIESKKASFDEGSPRGKSSEK